MLYGKFDIEFMKELFDAFIKVSVVPLKINKFKLVFFTEYIKQGYIGDAFLFDYISLVSRCNDFFAIALNFIYHIKTIKFSFNVYKIMQEKENKNIYAISVETTMSISVLDLSFMFAVNSFKEKIFSFSINSS